VERRGTSARFPLMTLRAAWDSPPRANATRSPSPGAAVRSRPPDRGVWWSTAAYSPRSGTT